MDDRRTTTTTVTAYGGDSGEDDDNDGGDDWPRHINDREKNGIKSHVRVQRIIRTVFDRASTG